MVTLDSLPSAGAINGADLLLIRQSGTDKKVTAANLVAGANAAYDPDGSYPDGSIGDALGQINQTATGDFYVEDGAVVQRMNDRVFMGGGTAHDGTDVAAQDDWLTTYILSTGRTFAFQQGAQAAILTNNSRYASNALVAGAQTVHYTDARNAIAVIGVGVNNNATLGTGAWGGYFEGFRDTSSVGPTYASEHDSINRVNSVPVTTPYSQAGNQIVSVQIASGGEYANGVYDASVAINIKDNGAKYLRGIVFGNNSLTGSNGTTGTAEALSFAKGHGQIWYASGGSQVSAIYGTATTAEKGATFNLTDDRVVLSNFSSGKWIFRMENIGTSSVNYPGVVPSATGNKVQFRAYGDDTNVGIQITPQGTGKVNIPIGNVPNYANDAAAQAGGLLVGDIYRNGSVLMIRVS